MRRWLHKGTKWVLEPECCNGPWGLQDYSFPVIRVASEVFWDLLWEVCGSATQVATRRRRIKYEFTFRKSFSCLSPTASFTGPTWFLFPVWSQQNKQKSNSRFHLLLPCQAAAPRLPGQLAAKETAARLPGQIASKATAPRLPGSVPSQAREKQFRQPLASQATAPRLPGPLATKKEAQRLPGPLPAKKEASRLP